jgi:hypothetical protein
MKTRPGDHEKRQNGQIWVFLLLVLLLLLFTNIVLEWDSEQHYEDACALARWSHQRVGVGKHAPSCRTASDYVLVHYGGRPIRSRPAYGCGGGDAEGGAKGAEIDVFDTPVALGATLSPWALAGQNHSDLWKHNSNRDGGGVNVLALLEGRQITGHVDPPSCSPSWEVRLAGWHQPWCIWLMLHAFLRVVLVVVWSK